MEDLTQAKSQTQPQPRGGKAQAETQSQAQSSSQDGPQHQPCEQNANDQPKIPSLERAKTQAQPHTNPTRPPKNPDDFNESASEISGLSIPSQDDTSVILFDDLE